MGSVHTFLLHEIPDLAPSEPTGMSVSEKLLLLLASRTVRPCVRIGIRVKCGVLQVPQGVNVRNIDSGVRVDSYEANE